MMMATKDARMTVKWNISGLKLRHNRRSPQKNPATVSTHTPLHFSARLAVMKLQWNPYKNQLPASSLSIMHLHNNHKGPYKQQLFPTRTLKGADTMRISVFAPVLENILYPTFTRKVRSLVQCDDTADAACWLLRCTDTRTQGTRSVHWRQTRHRLKWWGLATVWRAAQQWTNVRPVYFTATAITVLSAASHHSFNPSFLYMIYVLKAAQWNNDNGKENTCLCWHWIKFMYYIKSYKQKKNKDILNWYIPIGYML